MTVIHRSDAEGNVGTGMPGHHPHRHHLDAESTDNEQPNRGEVVGAILNDVRCCQKKPVSEMKKAVPWFLLSKEGPCSVSTTGTTAAAACIGAILWFAQGDGIAQTSVAVRRRRSLLRDWVWRPAQRPAIQVRKVAHGSAPA